ncbi:ABC transporter ATP-binding protein [Bradyrhizobium sp. LA7.1]|uniref:ABC transporter ATP-binding protein n=1 Tax=Bradyrhizobium sp. LA7.1 TaxID=3156324 RepID=UPI003399F07B
MLLEARGLAARYGRIKVLHEIDVDIGEGEIVAVVGANGAGKTTMLRSLSGVMPLAAGQIFFESKPLHPLRSDQRVLEGIAQVAEGRQVFGKMSVEDNLRLGAFRRRGSADALDRMFARFPILFEKRRHFASSLSGGQQQQLAIARALMSDPKLLLLDEPSMGLAPLAVREIFELIEQLKAAGKTILLVEQNARAALAVADRVYVLENGAVLQCGSAAEVAASESVKRAYLGY